MPISAVPELTRTVKLPTSQEKWQPILRAACTLRRCGLEREDTENFGKGLDPGGSRVCPVHWECRLVQYLEAKNSPRDDNIPPCDYIGVSLGSAAAPHLDEAFNKQSGQRSIREARTRTGVARELVGRPDQHQG